MKNVVVDAKAFFAGVTYLLIGIAALALSFDYETGTALRMGPGFFPAMISTVLICLGSVSIVQGVWAKTPERLPKLKLEPLVLVLAGVISFALLIESAGLVVATAALIFLSCFRRLRTNPIEVLLVYLALTGFSAFVFVHLFGMVIPIWPHLSTIWSGRS